MNSQNELAILEFIHSLVETMDKYFESVCELDVSPAISWTASYILLIIKNNMVYFQIMFHIEKAHYIVDEMVANGAIGAHRPTTRITN